jgi:TetR/AcrR family transcriptional regulator
MAGGHEMGGRASDVADREMLFGELQGAKPTPAKRLAHALLKQYAKRLNVLIDTAKSRGELPPELDNQAAATLFIGTIQGLIMQSLIVGDMERMRLDAPRVFVIYRRGIVYTDLEK